MSKVDPADTRMEISCVGARIAAKYVRAKYGNEMLLNILNRARLNLSYIENPRNWMSQESYYRFLEYLVEDTGNPNAPYESWKYMVDSKSLGPITLLAIRLGTVRGIYNFTASGNQHWSRVSEWKKLYLGRNRLKLSVKILDYPQDKNNCMSIQGLMAAVPPLLGLPPAQVNELQCACDGADACIYDVKWVNKPAYLLSLIGTAIGSFALLIYCLLFGYNSLPVGVMTLFPFAGFLFGRMMAYSRNLERVYSQNEEQAESIQEAMEEIAELNRDLQEKIEVRTNELSDAYEELKESQEIALRAERQAGVGVLAAGMAHELNNPINAIRLSLQTGLKTNVSEEQRQELLENAVSATARCKRIVGDLLSFARKDSRLVQSDLAHVLTRCVETFKEEKPAGVEISMMSESDLPDLLVDEEQIQQVVRNLMSNAVDAMEDHGRIELNLKRDGDDVVVIHKDTGPGMNDDVAAKIFDPFFSTKPGRSSKGLGLSICADLVARNGGRIDLLGAKGEGAEFVMRFPVHGKEKSSE